ncbi:hypothetical protein B0H19DRAFT_1082854 [Mycena capillaripes]|nr:hypothetical protein B0H19DRAFT_1082854 [Mycena capillaripes]
MKADQCRGSGVGNTQDCLSAAPFRTQFQTRARRICFRRTKALRYSGRLGSARSFLSPSGVRNGRQRYADARDTVNWISAPSIFRNRIFTGPLQARCSTFALSITMLLSSAILPILALVQGVVSASQGLSLGPCAFFQGLIYALDSLRMDIQGDAVQVHSFAQPLVVPKRGRTRKRMDGMLSPRIHESEQGVPATLMASEGNPRISDQLDLSDGYHVHNAFCARTERSNGGKTGLGDDTVTSELCTVLVNAQIFYHRWRDSRRMSRVAAGQL